MSQYEYAEPLFELTLVSADGSPHTQRANGRLWNLYRGTTVGPYALQSILMALEMWLMEFAERRSQELDLLLLYILGKSNSAALTSVVSSVATAFPYSSVETLLVLLSCRNCIVLDRQRLSDEAQAPSRYRDFIGVGDPADRIYNEERKLADSLPHRRRDLENAILNLQFGPDANRVQDVLDHHRSALPPVDIQTDDDLSWRLAIHRMDWRQYRAVAADSTTTLDDNASQDSPAHVQMELTVPDPDIKRMVDQSNYQFTALNSQLGNLMWGMMIFARDVNSPYDPGEWRKKLTDARTNLDSGAFRYNLGPDGSGQIAAVCVRDHWDEMVVEEQNWCVDVACKEVAAQADYWDQTAQGRRFGMSPDRPCAWVMHLLMGKSLTLLQRKAVEDSLVLAVTHAVDEVRQGAVDGIGAGLWQIDREFAVRCVNALASESMLIQEATNAQSRISYELRRSIDEINRESANSIRHRFFDEGGIAPDAYVRLNLDNWYGAEANKHILAILSNATSETLAISGFLRFAQRLVGWWDADADRSENGQQLGQGRRHDTESSCSRLLMTFLLGTTVKDATTILQPILDAIDDHPKEIRWMITWLWSAEVQRSNTPSFWRLWEMFAERIRRASWLLSIDDEYAEGTEVIRTIFLGALWQQSIGHWTSLEGHDHHIHKLFEDLPRSVVVFESYLRFLYYIGDQSLPDSFVRLAKQLQSGDCQTLLSNKNTAFMLEALLLRFVYSRPLDLKRQKDLRNAILYLLDSLVENGSSAAFRMRDDFVTPLSHAHSVTS